MDEKGKVVVFFCFYAVAFTFASSILLYHCDAVGIEIIVLVPFSFLFSLFITMILDAIHESRINTFIATAIVFGIPLTYALNSCISAHPHTSLLLLISSIILFLAVFIWFDALYHYNPFD